MAGPAPLLRARGAPAALRLASALLLLVALAGPAGLTSADALDDRVAAARKALVTRLEDLATWCDHERVYAERDGVFRRILVLSPDHARARAALKYRRDGKGSPWVQSPDYREPVDWNKGVLPEAKTRMAEAAGAFRQEVVAALETMPDLKPSRREEAMERLVDLMPDDADLRRSRGDVEHKGRWVLPETVEAQDRRAAIAEAAQRALGGGGPFAPHRASLGMGWAWAFEVGPRIVVGDGTPAEGKRAAQIAFASEQFAAEMAALATRPKKPPKIYVFAKPDAARTWVRKNETDPDCLAGLDRVASLWLKGGELVILSATSEDRIDSIARQVVDTTFDLATMGEQVGWVAEGLQQRLLWHLLRRHGTPFVSYEGTDRPGDRSEAGELPPSESSWIRPAFEALDRAGPAEFRTLFTRKINAFRASDALMAYGLGSYLLEGRSDQLVAFLQATSTLEDPNAICQAALGVDADVLYWRVRRWLSEQ